MGSEMLHVRTSECPRELKGGIVLFFSHVMVFGKTSGLDTPRKVLWIVNFQGWKRLLLDHVPSINDSRLL